MTRPNDYSSGTSSGGGGPSGSAAPLSEATARRLVLALELLARRLGVGSPAAAAYANRDRAAAGAAHPAMDVMLVAAAAGLAAKAAAAGGGVAAATTTAAASGTSGQPVKVEVVKWSAAAPGGARQITDGVQDAEYTVRQPTALPGPAGPPEEEAPWGGTGAWKFKRELIDFDAMRAKFMQPVPKEKGEKEKESGSGVAKVLASLFGRVLGPLLAFNTILNASNSGMGVFQKAINVLATSLAPVLLPPMVLISAAVLTVADVLWEKLKPNLARWAAWVVEKGIPAVEQFIDSVDKAAKFLRIMAGNGDRTRRLATGEYGYREARQEVVDVFGPKAGEASDWLRKKTQWLRDAVPQSWLPGGDPRPTPGAGGRPRDADAPGPPGGRPPAEAGGGRTGGFFGNRARDLAEIVAPGLGGKRGTPATQAKMADNLSLVLTSLTRALGPKAEYTTAAGAAKARQLAAANGDPLDMKALLRAIESVQQTTAGVRDGIERLNQPTPQVPPSGRG